MDRLIGRVESNWTLQRSLGLIGLALLGGCGGRGAVVPTRLADGSRPPPPPRVLGELDRPVVMTRVRTGGPAGKNASLLASCLRAQGSAALGRREQIVVRVGVATSSLTFRGQPPGRIRGCDAGSRRAETGSRWCGSPVARLRPDGHLYDPRLNILCVDADRRQVGLAWIEPLRRTRYVAVQHRRYAEVYVPAAGLPIRVATDDVQVERSGATFRVAEYAADGTRLAHRRIHAVVAG